MNGMPPAPLAPPVGPAYGGHPVSDQQGYGAADFNAHAFDAQGFGAPVPNPGSARMKLGAVVGAVAVGLAAGALWGGLGPAPAKSPSEVRLESISFAGDSPFMPPVGEDRSGVDAPANTSGTFSGDTPGLFAADENKPSCDTRTLVSNLQADPGKAGAWADAVGITAADIPGYVDTLNPVVLRSDTAVTQYGYENGTFVPYPAVLEAGTAAFVNSRGEPRAKCFSGNPLSGTPALENVSYVGPTWNHFAPTTVTYVKPAPVVIKVYVYVDIDRHTSYHHDSKPSWHGDDSSWCDRHPDKCDHHGGKDHDGDKDDHGKGGDHDGKDDHSKGGDHDGKDGQPGKDGKDGQNGQDKDKDPKDGQNPPAGPGDKNDKDGKDVDQKNGPPEIDDKAKLLTGDRGPTTPGGGTENPPKVDGPTGQHENPPVQAPIELFKPGVSGTGSSGGATGSAGKGSGAGSAGNGSGTGFAGNGSRAGSTGTGASSTGTGTGTGSGAGTAGATKPGTGWTGTGPAHRIGRTTGTSTGTSAGTSAGSGAGTGTGAGSGSGAGAGTAGSTTGTTTESGTGNGEHAEGKRGGHDD